MDAQGNHIGYMAEQDKGLASTMARQWFHTHRSFVTHVFDRQENEVLRVSSHGIVIYWCDFRLADHRSSIARFLGLTLRSMYMILLIKPQMLTRRPHLFKAQPPVLSLSLAPDRVQGYPHSVLVKCELSAKPSSSGHLCGENTISSLITNRQTRKQIWEPVISRYLTLVYHKHSRCN